MIKNAFAYITRKSLKSIIIMLVILAMSTLSLISLSIKDATDRASKETFANITNSFSMEINRQVNPGTPRGGGNVKGEDIKKIAQTDSIDSYVKRINSVADLVDYDIIETKETLANQSPKRAKNFKRTVMLTGVNDSSKETKFVSEAYKLVEGKHLENEDKNKILMHKDLAEKNNLKVGDKIKIKSNLFDADNEKQADETVEVEIKGLFDGHNSGGVSVAQELYENTLITSAFLITSRSLSSTSEYASSISSCVTTIFEGLISALSKFLVYSNKASSPLDFTFASISATALSNFP